MTLNEKQSKLYVGDSFGNIKAFNAKSMIEIEDV
jgi:hypothetical protein